MTVNILLWFFMVTHCCDIDKDHRFDITYIHLIAGLHRRMVLNIW